MGLSTLCEALLGKPLDKSMQVSDWGRRPLSEAQLRWAGGREGWVGWRGGVGWSSGSRRQWGRATLSLGLAPRRAARPTAACLAQVPQSGKHSRHAANTQLTPWRAASVPPCPLRRSFPLPGRYAALDAHSAVLIYQGLAALNPAFATRSGLEAYTFTVLLPPPASHKRHWTGDGGDSGDEGPGGGGAAGGQSGPSEPQGNSGGGGGGSSSGMEVDESSAAGEGSSNGGYQSGSESGMGVAAAASLYFGPPASSSLPGTAWACEPGAQQPHEPACAAQLPQLVVEELRRQGLLSAVRLLPQAGPAGERSQQISGSIWGVSVLNCGVGPWQSMCLYHGSASLGCAWWQSSVFNSLRSTPSFVPAHCTGAGGGMAGSIEEAAAALGADPHQLCKALAVVGQGGRRAAVALVPGGLRLSLRKALSLLPRRLLLPASRAVPAMRCTPGRRACCAAHPSLFWEHASCVSCAALRITTPCPGVPASNPQQTALSPPFPPAGGWRDGVAAQGHPPGLSKRVPLALWLRTRHHASLRLLQHTRGSGLRPAA